MECEVKTVSYRLSDTENRSVVAKGEGGGMEWEVGVSICIVYIGVVRDFGKFMYTLLYISTPLGVVMIH